MRQIPVLGGRFVGRRSELASVRRALQRGEVVTLHGPGGAGKTRLAVEIIEARRRRGGGTVFVDLGPVNAPELVQPAFASAVGVSPAPGSAVDRALRALAERSDLVVLDNCEHVLDECRTLIGRIRAEVPDARVLTTSREVLGLPGECVVGVGALPLDRGPGHLSDAETLFLDRAARVDAARDPSELDLDLVRQVCERLDGNPLAIELAAARLAVLSLTELAERVEDPLQLLRQQGGGRRLPSMEDSLDWTFELCSPRGQAMFLDASVFRGSFTVAAAEAVTGAGPDALDVLHELVAKSVLLTVRGTGPRRFRMLEVVRRYAASRLRATGRLDRLRHAHAAWYAGRGADLELRWLGPGQLDRFHQAQADLPNTRAALEHVLGRPAGPDADLLLGLAVLPNPQQWWTAGLVEEGRIWLDRVLSVASDPDLRARTLYAGTTYAAALGDEAGTRELLAASVEIAARLDRPEDRSGVAFVRGFVALLSGDPVEARRIARDGLRELAEDSVEPTAFRLLQVLTYAQHLLGETDETAAACREVLRRSDLCQDEVYYRSFAQHVLGALAWREGDLDGACALLTRALGVMGEVPLRPENTDALVVAANVAYEIGEPGAAARLLGATETTRRTEIPLTPGQHALAVTLGQRYAELRRDRPDEWALGRELTPAAACDLALEVLSPRVPEDGRAGDGEPLPTWLLTPREVEVARLLLLGSTNRQIAAHLTVSVRTAEGHVERLRVKLAASSRREIVARLRVSGFARADEER